MRTIVLNQSNLVSDGKNSTLVYKFPNSIQFVNSEIAVSSISMFYSWFNIQSAYGNHQFQFNWISSSGGSTYTTYTITIPDGLYEISDINNFIQWVCINAPSLSTSVISPTPTAPFYLVNDAGQYVYYFEFEVNPTRYGVQLNTYNVPTSLPTGWTNTAGTFLGAQSFNPKITIPSAFNSIIGFAAGFETSQNTNNAGTNPATTVAYKIGSTYSYLSTTAPQVQPNSNLLISLSNIDNKYAVPSSIIYCLSPSVAIGEQIIDKPPEFSWNKLLRGTYNELRIQLLGADYQPVTIKDPQITILLAIKDIGGLAP